MKIGIGTVQFGMPYGIKETGGLMSQLDVNAILARSLELGSHIIDTAPCYGFAEARLGKFDKLNMFQCLTKTVPTTESTINRVSANRVLDAFKSSLKKIRLPACYGLLVHDCADLSKPGAERLIDMMFQVKAEGLVSKVGVSVYTAADVDVALSIFDFDLIQLPISIFNQSFLRNGYVKSLSQMGVEIHARSVFHQGALLMQPNDLPERLSGIAEPQKILCNKAKELNVSLEEFALGFLNSINELHVAIVGVNSVEELDALMQAKCTKALCDYEAFHLDDVEWNNPANWPTN